MNARSAAGRAAPAVFVLLTSLVLAGVAPARAQSAAATIGEGQALEAAGKLDQAIAEYGKAIAAEPVSAAGWLRRGWARVKAKDNQGALADLDHAIQLDAANAEAHKNRAAALCNLQRFQDAIPAATRAIEIRPGFSAAYFYRGFAKFRLLDFGGAMEDETRAIQAKPDNWDAFRIRGTANVELKRHREALEDLDTAVAHDMLGGRLTYHYRAIAKHALGDTRGALDDEDRELEMNPTYAKGYAARGIYRSVLGDRAGAEADYRRALALDPNEGVAKSGLAKLNRIAVPPLDPREVDDLNRIPDEVKALAAFRASPTPSTREALGAVRLEHALHLAKTAEQQLDEKVLSTALAYAESAAALAPENPAAWLLLGRLYASIEGNPVAADMAEQSLRAALELKPGLDEARVALAQLYFRRGSYDRALGELEPAVAAHPALATPDVVSMMGWSYIYDFQLDRGIGFFRDLSGRNPKAEPLAIGLAVLLRENGANADATRALNALANDARTAAATRDYAKALLADWAKGGRR